MEKRAPRTISLRGGARNSNNGGYDNGNRNGSRDNRARSRSPPFSVDDSSPTNAPTKLRVMSAVVVPSQSASANDDKKRSVVPKSAIVAKPAAAPATPAPVVAAPVVAAPAKRVAPPTKAAAATTIVVEESYGNDDEPALADALDGEFGDERIVVPHGSNTQHDDGSDDNDNQHHEPEATVLLRNLDKAVTAKDLLLDVFKDDGEIVSCNVLLDRNNQPSGSAELLFQYQTDAELAIKRHTGKLLNGKKLLLSLIGASTSSRTALPVARATPPAKAAPKVAANGAAASAPAKRVASAIAAAVTVAPKREVKSNVVPAKRQVRATGAPAAAAASSSSAAASGGLSSRIPWRMRSSDDGLTSGISSHDSNESALLAGATAATMEEIENGSPLITNGNGENGLLLDYDNGTSSFGFADSDISSSSPTATKPVFVISNVKKLKSVATNGVSAISSSSIGSITLGGKKRPLPTLRADRFDDNTANDDDDNTTGGIRKRGVVVVKKGRNGGAAASSSSAAGNGNSFNAGGRKVVKKARR